MVLSRRVIKDTALGSDASSSKKMRDYALFLTAGIIVSSVALPIILARTPVEKPLVSSNYSDTLSSQAKRLLGINQYRFNS